MSGFAAVDLLSCLLLSLSLFLSFAFFAAGDSRVALLFFSLLRFVQSIAHTSVQLCEICLDAERHEKNRQRAKRKRRCGGREISEKSAKACTKCERAKLPCETERKQ
jgi:hypothetical protein